MAVVFLCISTRNLEEVLPNRISTIRLGSLQTGKVAPAEILSNCDAKWNANFEVETQPHCFALTLGFQALQTVFQMGSQEAWPEIKVETLLIIREAKIEEESGTHFLSQCALILLMLTHFFGTMVRYF